MSVDTFIEDITELDWNHVPPCEGVYDDNTQCERPASFICSTACCHGKILLCEECFFGFIEYSKKYQGTGYRCAFCDESFVLTPDHLKVVGKV